MADSNDDKIANRLAALQKRPPASSWVKKAALPAGMLALGAGLGAWVALVPTPEKVRPQLGTSDVTEFQDSGTGLEGFTITRPKPTPAVEIKTVPDTAANAELAKLRTELEAQRAELDAAKAAAANSPELAAMKEQVAQMEAEAEARKLAADELERENLRLQSQMQTNALLGTSPVGIDPTLDLEAQRRAELEQRRAAAEELRQKRVNSPMVVYRFGGGSGDQSAAGGEMNPVQGGGQGSEPQDFRRSGAKSSEVTRAEVIGRPSHTVLQGTLIEATLQTAISSQIEGNISAVVSRDVLSMDMTNVVIPRGSKLFGRYDANVDRGQNRVMIAWDRLVTPDGQSLQLEAYGTDRIGRSGLTGHVNSRTLQRFSAAAAVSIIGAAPAVLSAALEKDRKNDISRETAGKLGESMNASVGKVFEQYMEMPTTISVDQGAVVMVMVNNDLELL